MTLSQYKVKFHFEIRRTEHDLFGIITGHIRSQYRAKNEK